MSDIMDEFEFRPLTEGLGFHQRSGATEKAEIHTSPLQQIMDSNLSTPTPTQRETQSTTISGGLGNLSTPLPRPNNTEKPFAKDLPSTTVDEILKTLNSKKRPQFDGKQNLTTSATAQTSIGATTNTAAYKATSIDLAATLLDAMLVVAINLTCLILLLVTTKVDLFANLFRPDKSGMIYLSLATLFAGSTWIFLVSTRMFLGATPGEWVFDQRLGQPEETGSAMYSLLVAARATLVVLTGIVLFPLASLVMNKDVLGQIMGLELVKKS